MAGDTGRAKTGKKNRKLGRNKIGCTRYEQENRKYFNKIRKMERHLKQFPEDKNSANRLRALQF